jgi:hypothetical protein
MAHSEDYLISKEVPCEWKYNIGCKRPDKHPPQSAPWLPTGSKRPLVSIYPSGSHLCYTGHKQPVAFTGGENIYTHIANRQVLQEPTNHNTNYCICICIVSHHTQGINHNVTSIPTPGCGTYPTRAPRGNGAFNAVSIRRRLECVRDEGYDHRCGLTQPLSFPITAFKQRR